MFLTAEREMTISMTEQETIHISSRKAMEQILSATVKAQILLRSTDIRQIRSRLTVQTGMILPLHLRILMTSL